MTEEELGKALYEEMKTQFGALWDYVDKKTFVVKEVRDIPDEDRAVIDLDFDYLKEKIDELFDHVESIGYNCHLGAIYGLFPVGPGVLCSNSEY